MRGKLAGERPRSNGRSERQDTTVLFFFFLLIYSMISATFKKSLQTKNYGRKYIKP